MCQSISECVFLVGTQLRGGHHGQRPFAPHQQVEHMAAPTSSASPVTKALPTGRRPHMGIEHALIEQCATGKTKTVAVSAIVQDQSFQAR
jgi:hypothetical protein